MFFEDQVNGFVDNFMFWATTVIGMSSLCLVYILLSNKREITVLDVDEKDYSRETKSSPTSHSDEDDEEEEEDDEEEEEEYDDDDDEDYVPP